MPAPTGIDWEWALASGGNLSASQKRRLLAPLMRLVLRYPAARVRLATGRRGRAAIDLEAIRFPDSGLARAAAEEAHTTLAPYLVAHSYRTYLFGLMLAQVQGVTVDEEVTYVASLLHDATLESPVAERCFAVDGGVHAHRFALDHGADESRATAIGAAVAGHITPGAAEDLSDPAGFVSAGALADLTGFGLQHASAEWVDAVLSVHPRAGFADQILPAWNAAGAAAPDGRVHWINRYGSMPLLVRIAPFSDKPAGD